MKTRQSRQLETLHRHPQFQQAMKIIKTLKSHGFEAVLAGGCVRDSLLGTVPKDLDIATGAPPEKVEESFEQTLAVGKAFGTIVVIENGHNFEVTTFRREGGYSDGRHPDRVEFTDMREDAKRRDFTVNALFYDPVECEVFDFVNGMADLDAKILRTVGSARERFDEDKLRMLRAPRFVAQLGFELEQESFVAIQALHKQIEKVSTERVFNEMKRLLGARFLIEGLEVFRDSKLSQEIWSEVDEVNFRRLQTFGRFMDWESAFAAVQLLAEKKNAEMILRAWKAPRESIRRVNALMEGCKVLLDQKTSRAGRMRVLGMDDFAGALQLAQGFLADQPERVEAWIKEFLSVAGDDGKLPQALLNGQDLISAGVKPGAEMGNLLREIYDAQLEGKVRSKDEALAALSKAIS